MTGDRRVEEVFIYTEVSLAVESMPPRRSTHPLHPGPVCDDRNLLTVRGLQIKVE